MERTRQRGWDNGKGKKKGKMVPTRRSRCPMSTRYREFFAAGETPCWKEQATLLSRNRSIISEIMINQLDVKEYNYVNIILE